MLQRWTRTNNAATLAVALSLMTIAPAPAQEVAPPPEPAGDAGYFYITGGAVKRKLAKTQTTPTRFGETAGWYSLPLANLSFTVPTNTTDLFNVSFTAECRLFNGGGDDYVRIRVIDTVTGIVMEPYDGAQAFFSADGYATHTGMWSKRFGPGAHNLQVQFWIYDGLPNEILTAIVDDWTFELIVYE
jgi:hypothetical protein